MHFRGVIFDVDGTLVDSNDAHAKAFQEALEERGVQLPYEKIRRLIGEGADKLIPALIGSYDTALAARKGEIFKQRYLARLRPFPGAAQLVHELHSRRLRLAVASSANKNDLDALLRAAGVLDCFADKTSADDAAHSKPDPDIVQAAVRKLALPPASCVLIGDTPYDAQAARRAGVAFIGVRCGGWGDADLQPARGVYDDPAALLAEVSGSAGCARRIPS